MDNVLELARKLGQEIRNSERYLLLREAEKKVMADPTAKKIQDDLEKQLHKIRDLETQMKPVEVADGDRCSARKNGAPGEPAENNHGISEK